MKKIDSDLIDAITNHIKRNCVGKENANTVKQIATSIHKELEEDDTTGSYIRSAIKHILTTTTMPIGSYVGGYYLVSTQDEYDEVQADLDKRIDGIFNRKIEIEANWSLHKTVQHT